MTGFLKWVGTAFGIAGAVLVAANIPESGWGFVLFLVSSSLWGCAGWRMRETSIVAINAPFTIVNLVGISRWLIA